MTSDEVWERVYDIEVEGESTFRIEGSVSISKVRNTVAKTRVDDISEGEVALLVSSDEPEATAYTRIGPEQARELATALTNAAEYAAEQKQSQDGGRR